MVDACQLDRGWVAGRIAGDPLNCQIEIEQQRSLAVVANHALNPEEGSNARAASHRIYMVKAGRWVEDQMTCGQLDAVDAVGVFHHQFAAVVFVRRIEEEGRRQIGADAMRRTGHLADCIVDVGAGDGIVECRRAAAGWRDRPTRPRRGSSRLSGSCR